MAIVVVDVVLLRLTHRQNIVRGHNTDSNSSGVDEHLRKKCNTMILLSVLDIDIGIEFDTIRIKQKLMYAISIFDASKLSLSTCTQNTGIMLGDGGQNTFDISIHRNIDISIPATWYIVTLIRYPH